MTPTSVRAHAIPIAIVSMVCSGFTIIQAYRHHADLPIEYVASRTGLTVHRVSQIEGGAIATAAETTAIHKAVGIPPQFAAAA